MNTWYLQRLKTMTLPELAYRVGQWKQANTLKKEMGLKGEVTDCTTVPAILPPVDDSLSGTARIEIFGIEVDPAQIDDWSYDVFTKKFFPKKYAKHIDIRTEEYGSAKHVWELNRMLFLPRLAMQYRSTGNMHYVTLIMRLISSWVEQNPYLTGVNWYSNIEINIRLINWLLTWEIMQADELAANDAFFKSFTQETWIPTIYQHCKFSYAHPSLHSSANNHLIAEYAGLFIATSKWIFTESKSWNEYAKRGLEKEILQQHSVNGINREEAAEYIQFITDFLLLSLLVGDYTNNPFSGAFRERFSSVLHYISVLLTVNGQFPKYGDEDDGRVFLLNSAIHDNNFVSLLQSGALYFNDTSFLREGEEIDQKNRILFGDKKVAALADQTNGGKMASSKFYPDEGHFFFKKQTASGKEIYCHFDAAALGYLSIAAHGHADALSFVLYIDGHPFFIDPGTYCYHTDATWRRYFVSTRAHNTVSLAGIDQASFVGPTLWLNHYKVRIKDYGMSGDYEYVMAAHNGYKKYRVEHTRKLEFFRSDEKIVITDYVTTAKNVDIEMPFHLHPDAAYQLNGHQCIVTMANRQVVMTLDERLQWEIVKGMSDPCLGWYSAGFYKKSPSPVIMGSIKNSPSMVLKTELVIS
jgi:hypothetical protein